MIPIKTENDLEKMRTAGKILVKIIQKLKGSLRPGVSTQAIDQEAERLIKSSGCVSAFKGYKGYPANICISINEEIVHGIPGERKIIAGDIVSLDVGIKYQNYFSDAAITVGIGRITDKLKKLIEVTKKSLFEGIKQMRPHKHLYDISYAIQNYVEKHGFSVVREFVGHGIGSGLHEEPEIPNFSVPGNAGALLEPGMVFAVEPMVNMGHWKAEILGNGWTAVTKDRLASAHFEHTVAVTSRGSEILTRGI